MFICIVYSIMSVTAAIQSEINPALTESQERVFTIITANNKYKFYVAVNSNKNVLNWTPMTPEQKTAYATFFAILDVPNGDWIASNMSDHIVLNVNLQGTNYIFVRQKWAGPDYLKFSDGLFHEVRLLEKPRWGWGFKPPGLSKPDVLQNFDFEVKRELGSKSRSKSRSGLPSLLRSTARVDSNESDFGGGQIKPRRTARKINRTARKINRTARKINRKKKGSPTRVANF